jgi:anti-sigma factor RsiW
VSGSDIHQRTIECFSDYLDNELDPEARARVDEHIASCLQCRVTLDRLRRTVGGLTGLRRAAPGGFLADIKQQIHVRSRGRFFGKKRLLFGRIPFEWVSLAMIIAMLLYYIVFLQSSPTGVVPGN